MRKEVRSRLIHARALLLRWHRTKNNRTFSWRHDTRDPYAVLVCEMMGQQTQASRIEVFLKRFLDQFPTIDSLARAKQRDVIRAWQGLGYNRRALHLHNAAKQVVQRHNGTLPNTEEELLALPGIGKYTAGAIRVFAFEEASSAVDVNVSRVLTRLTKKVRDHADLLSLDVVQEINSEIMPLKNVRDWHEAIMDLGATICVKNKPTCEICPLRSVCPSTALAAKRSVRSKNTRSKEKLYVGSPKRIWRGRVLKLISKAHRVTVNAIESSLIQEYHLGARQSSEITVLVLDDLLKERFIIRSPRGFYSLK